MMKAITTVQGEENRGVENHVLMVSFCAQGHINPLHRLGKLLISKGLHVTLATNDVTRQLMQISGDTSKASGVDLVFFSDGMSLDYNRGANLDNFMDTIGKAGPTNLSALIKERYGGRRKLLCLIANPFVPWVADVAVDLGIPSALLWIQPCSLFSIYYSFYNESACEVPNFPTEDEEEDCGKSVELPGLPPLTFQDLPSFVLPNNPFNSMSKAMLELFSKSLLKFKWVLMNSFYELEKSVIDSVSHRILPIGPLVPHSLLGHNKIEAEDSVVEMWRSNDSCIGWLDKQEHHSVIYVSFGSMIALPAKQMEYMATALKNSRRPFLWVAKLPEITSTSGAGQLPLGFLDETKDQGRVVSWSPQTRVLVHPAVACYVTHCGWNSILEAVSSGVPLIAYPQWTDQPTNAKLITDMFKNGVRLEKDETGIVTSSEIEKCIERVMNGDKAVELRKNAEELKRAARLALSPGGSSENTIQLFVDSVITGDKCYYN